MRYFVMYIKYMRVDCDIFDIEICVCLFLGIYIVYIVCNVYNICIHCIQ